MAESKMTKRALVVWVFACCIYIIAVTGRTSFGVAGVAAMDRFHIDASRLAVFTAVQVGVYALAQIPVGLLIDQFGARRILLWGAVLMAAGQIALALAPTYGLAIAARVLIGAGDATAFLSVMRLLPVWFPIRRAPLFAQLTGAFGQIGQFLSAVPFLHLLQAQGWEPAFLTLGIAGVLTAVVASIFVSNSRVEPRFHVWLFNRKNRLGVQRAQQLPLKQRFGLVVRDPIVWQAVCIHWTGLMPLSLLFLLWGVPLMSLGMGLSTPQIATVLTLGTAVTVASGPIHGVFSARLGRRRNTVALWAVALIFLATLGLFLPGSPGGFWTMAAYICAISFLGPVSNYGFDTVRETVDMQVLATATGLANMGGFSATMIAAQLLGVFLDHFAPDGDYQWADFRVAWIAVGATFLAGYFGLLLARAKTKPHRAVTISASTTPQ